MQQMESESVLSPQPGFLLHTWLFHKWSYQLNAHVSWVFPTKYNTFECFGYLPPRYDPRIDN